MALASDRVLLAFSHIRRERFSMVLASSRELRASSSVHDRGKSAMALSPESVAQQSTPLKTRCLQPLRSTDECVDGRYGIFRPTLPREGPGLTRAAEPPADQFGTLALPAHSPRESWRLGGRHRPASGFPDHWAGSRTETI